MPVSAKDLFGFAKKNATSTDEVDRRAAASRAYYSIFHYAQQFEFFPRAVLAEKTGVHAKFIKALTDNPDSKVRTLGFKVQQAYKLRISADYDISYPFTLINGTMAVETVRDVRKELQSFKKTGS